MRLVVISDTHNRHKKITLPDGDVLIHCGDATGQGRSSEIKEFAKWFHKQPHKYKIFVAGNHDIEFQKYPLAAEDLLLRSGPASIHYLKDSGIDIEGVKFWGSPWTKKFGHERWVFMAEDVDLKPHWDRIPNGVDVLITHGPPLYTLDRNEMGEHCGSSTLADRIREVRPQLNVFGHIHESYGVWPPLYRRETSHDPIDYGNAAICDLGYNPINKPLVFDVSPRGDNGNTPVS